MEQFHCWSKWYKDGRVHDIYCMHKRLDDFPWSPWEVVHHTGLPMGGEECWPCRGGLQLSGRLLITYSDAFQVESITISNDNRQDTVDPLDMSTFGFSHTWAVMWCTIWWNHGKSSKHSMMNLWCHARGNMFVASWTSGSRKLLLARYVVFCSSWNQRTQIQTPGLDHRRLALAQLCRITVLCKQNGVAWVTVNFSSCFLICYSDLVTIHVQDGFHGPSHRRHWTLKWLWSTKRREMVTNLTRCRNPWAYTTHAYNQWNKVWSHILHVHVCLVCRAFKPRNLWKLFICEFEHWYMNSGIPTN